MEEARLVFYAGATLLEGPRWNSQRQELLCVSIEQERIFLVNDDCQSVKTFKTDGQVGFALFLDAENILYAAYNGVYKLNISSGKQTFLFQANEDKTLRYNDGDFDPAGRILLGTTGYKRSASGQCCLYSADKDGKNIKKIIENTSISNGIAFSSDKKYLYFIDTPTKKVGRYIYNLQDGSCTFDKYIIEIQGPGLPDGMCIDKDNNLYVAEWGGSRVCKWDAESGKLLKEYPLPVKNVSSCTIGGKNMDTLFITSAAHDDGSKSELAAGGLFKIKI